MDAALRVSLLLSSLTLAPVATGQDQPTLRTRWAAEVDPAHVHAEYPRPQLVREGWRGLNGTWHYAIRPSTEPRPEQADGDILVPFPVESSLSGVQRRVAPDQTLWYWRDLELPPSWREGRVLLHFGAVDWEARVWCNGQEVGTHRGGYDPFTFEITGALGEGERQALVVAVTDPTDAGTQPRGKQVRDPQGIWYTPVTGLWQTVWLESVPDQFIERVRFTPDLDREELHGQVWLRDATAGHHLRITARSQDAAATEVANVEVAAAGTETGAGGAVSFTLSIPAPELWSPSNPALYDLEFVLLEGDRALDQVQSYFAMRSLDVRPDADGVRRLCLNGQPLFQYGLLDQGYWPDGLYTAPTDAALRHDVEVTRDLGFNMIRKHVKVEPDRWYSLCDRLGILVWQDMPSGDRNIGPHDPDVQRSAASAAQYELELGRIMDALHNHPCVVMWVPFNEGWGQFDTARITGWVQERDPSRPVNSPSGWADRDVGDVHDFHVYPGPGIPPPSATRARVLGEFGGLGLPLAGHTWQDERNWGYRSYPDATALTDAYVAAMERLHFLVGEGLSAAVYTQTTDVEVEVNGVMTYDRARIKLDADRVRAAHAMLFQPPPRLHDVVATSQDEAQRWRYTFEEPPAGWTRPDFDDSSWQEGPGGFGREGTPGAVVRTAWTGEHIWLRRRFDCDDAAAGPLRLSVHHDEDAEVHLNGRPIASFTGYSTAYELSSPIELELRAGANTLAVHCRQTGGGQYIDVGIVKVVRGGRDGDGRAGGDDGAPDRSPRR